MRLTFLDPRGQQVFPLYDKRGCPTGHFYVIFEVVVDRETRGLRFPAEKPEDWSDEGIARCLNTAFDGARKYVATHPFVKENASSLN